MARLLALPIAVAVNAMDIYNSVQIEYLKRQLTKIKENTGRLFTVVDYHENAIQDLEAGMNMQDFKAVQEICEFNIEPVSEKGYRLRKNRFLAYLPRAMTVPVKCVNRTKSEKHLGAGSRIFTISSCCEAQCTEHLVLSNLSIKMPADVLHFTWNWVPADLFDTPSRKVAPDLRKLEKTWNQQTQTEKFAVSDVLHCQWQLDVMVPDHLMCVTWSSNPPNDRTKHSRML